MKRNGCDIYSYPIYEPTEAVQVNWMLDNSLWNCWLWRWTMDSISERYNDADFQVYS